MHCIYCDALWYTHVFPFGRFHTHTHTYIYIYIYMGGPWLLGLTLPPPLHTSAPLPLAKGEDGV